MFSCKERGIPAASDGVIGLISVFSSDLRALGFAVCLGHTWSKAAPQTAGSSQCIKSSKISTYVFL